MDDWDASFATVPLDLANDGETLAAWGVHPTFRAMLLAAAEAPVSAAGAPGEEGEEVNMPLRRQLHRVKHDFALPAAADLDLRRV